MSRQTTSNSLGAATVKAALLNILCEYGINTFSIDLTMPDGENLKCDQKASSNKGFQYSLFQECSSKLKDLLAQNNITKYHLTLTPYATIFFEIKPNIPEHELAIIGEGGVIHFEHGHFV